MSLTVSRHISFEGCLKGNFFVVPGGVQAFENLNQTFVSLGDCVGWGWGTGRRELHVEAVFLSVKTHLGLLIVKQSI